MLYLFAPPPAPCMIAICRVGGHKELLYFTFLGSPWFSASQGGRDYIYIYHIIVMSTPLTPHIAVLYIYIYII